MDKKVPFVPNEPDDLHCLQAAYMMIAKYFDPNFDITMNEWSKITCFDKSTWESAGLLWFKENGYDVKRICLFNYVYFVKLGADYIIREYGQETADWQTKNSNIPEEMKRAEKLIASVDIERREPTSNDIRAMLGDGYLVRLLVNSNKLKGVSGYTGHSVVVFGYDDNGVIMHDPGLPPLPNRRVSWKKLESAWAYPNPAAKELDAIKLK